MAHVHRQNGYRSVQLTSSCRNQEGSRNCKKVAMPKVPEMQEQPRSSTSCQQYSSNRLSTASIGNELYNNRSITLYSPTFPNKYSTVGKLGSAGDTFGLGNTAKAPIQQQPENTSLVNGLSNYCSTATAAYPQPRALVERGIARPSSRPAILSNAETQDPLATESTMNMLPVIQNLKIKEAYTQSVHNSFPLMQTAGNRNSTGSSSSQTSSGFESGKTGSSTGCDSFNLVSSNSSSSCTSSNLVAAAIDSSPSSKISSSGSTTSAGRLSTYCTSLDEYSCDLTGGFGCTASGSNIISPEVTTKQSKSSKKAATSARVNIQEMMARGISESEILAEWLQRLCLSHCLALFISQGYDLISISRITPEDLTSLGISKPADRKRLMQDIQHWNIVDNWPVYVNAENGIRDWLICIGLTQYIDLLESQGYTTMHELQKVTWEDLEDIGINKLGHMKRICLALKKLKLGRTAGLKEDNFDCSSDYGTLTLHHTIHHMTCLPTTSTPSTFQPAESDYSCTTRPSNYYENTAYTSPYMTSNRKNLQQRQNQHQQKARSLIDMPKDRPVVTVRPSKKTSLIEEEHDDGSVIYKNSCFGLPKLNLYRTSQILSEFSELPKSLDGQPLLCQKYNAFYSQECPPSPAPIPSIAISKQINLGKHISSFSQPTTPKNLHQTKANEAALHQRTNF